jgi:hypothetical protein
MNGIYEANNGFDFNKIVYNTPVQVIGGNHFIKFKVNDKPLYIQPPKCLTKQSVSKSKKKLFCDLMFTNENGDFINWIETLEAKCLEQLFENREKWFDTELDKDDIENFFTSSLKIFKSGKFYTIRANIPTIMDKCSLKIYDEDEVEVELENIQENTNIITILEFQGIRCSSRNFQIEIEIKQILILKPVDLFEKCILRMGASNQSTTINENTIHNEGINPKTHINNLGIINDETNNIKKKSSNETCDICENQDNITSSVSMNLEETDNLVVLDKPEISEIEIDLDKLNETETIKLTNRDQVYYEMYKEARKKAKAAKQISILSYLEAKRIKQTYLLLDIEDSEDNDSEYNEGEGEGEGEGEDNIGQNNDGDR